MSLWLCLRFKQLPLQCLNRSEQLPVAVLHKHRILRLNDCAASLGISEGMTTATARALAQPAANGSILLLEQDSQAEQHALHQLCCWAYSITPALYIYRTDCLLLEIGGCLKLFNGLDILLAEINRDIGARGYSVQYGLAPTPKAAWLLSFTEAGDTLAAAGNAGQVLHQTLAERLAPLPLGLLDEFDTTVSSLQRAGLQTLGDILALPNSALSRRCGKKFTHFLQQALGQQQDLHLEYQPPKTFDDTYWFGYEVNANEELFPAVQLLLRSLCQFLRNTQLRTSDISWQLIGFNSKLQSITVRSSTSHSDWKNWYQLTAIRFEQLQLNSAVEGLTLNCHSLYEGELESIDLFSPRNQREPLSGLLDRLRNRMGLQAIEKIACRDEHLPEFAMHLSNDDTPTEHRDTQGCAQRPFWLMSQPQELRQHGENLYWNGALSLIYGPERIEDNWWLKAVSRDYYIAQNRDGQHYWIFCDRLTASWFIHGIFA